MKIPASIPEKTWAKCFVREKLTVKQVQGEYTAKFNSAG